MTFNPLFPYHSETCLHFRVLLLFKENLPIASSGIKELLTHCGIENEISFRRSGPLDDIRILLACGAKVNEPVTQGNL